MPCDTPYSVKPKGWLNAIDVPCGKCPNCKKRRVNEWVFRLQEEDKVSSTSYFITLTYDTVADRDWETSMALSQPLG